MLRHAVEGGDLEEYEAVVEARGVLPLGTPGRHKYAQLCERIGPIAAAVREATEGEGLPPLVVDLPLGDRRLAGQLGSLWPRARVTYTHGKLRSNRRLRHWIDHLALNCVAPAGYPGRSIYIARGDTDEEPHVEVLAPLTRQAREFLTELMEMFARGECAPLAFFPRSSAAFAEAILACKPMDQAWRDARKQWETPRWGSVPGEGDDTELELVFRGMDPLSESEPAFADLALQVFEPMLTARTEEAT
jgi:exodeoxyribonuclease V gamma subunit